jgi:hypothetical protein
MNQYACDECGAYISTDVDPAKARKVHRLAHLVIDADLQLRRLEVPANQIRDYVQKRIAAMQTFAQQHTG